MKACHAWHIEDRDHNKVSLNKVVEILDKQSPVNLNKMIKTYMYAKKHPEPTTVVKTISSLITE